ncbi:MAG: sulfatase-like hydrolase/transferase [Acidobacteria bacterium]|nr:sulfatase-like hydrolase/transferase [Acidobacteriota bacterium]
MMRRVDWRAIAIVSALVLPVCFFIPLQIFLNNIIEFSVSFAPLFLLFLLVSSGLIAVLYLAAGKLSSHIFLASVTFLSAVAFIESRIFFGLARHGPFDGNLIDWEPLSTLSYVELTVILAIAILIAVFRHRQELFYSISLFILLFHGIGFLHATITKLDVIQQSAGSDEGGSPYFSDFYRLSRERNVIHIVPDGTQGALMYEILASDFDRYSEVFDGFTFFSRATGRYPRTFASIAFFMTGRGPDPETDFVPSLPFTREYNRTLLNEHSLVNTLAAHDFKAFGYQVNNRYCVGRYTACAAGDIFHGRTINSRKAAHTGRTGLDLLDISLFQVTPVLIRRYIHNDERWFLSQLLTRTRTYSAIFDLFLENMTTDERPGSYNYFHVAGGHGPVLFGENCNYVGTRKQNYENIRAQVTCSLLQLERLVQKLKQLGIYDETMIILHSDHGSPQLTASLNSVGGRVILPHVSGLANPAILVKLPKMRGPLRFSRAPVSIGDVPATINGAFGLDGEFPGIPMFSLNETSERERVFLWYDLEQGGPAENDLEALPKVVRYRIRGDLFSREGWILPSPSHLEEAPAALTMDHPRFSRFALGFSKLENHSRPARWVEGALARAYLSFPTEGRAQLVFDTYTTPKITGQSMEVSVNNLIVAKLDEQDLAGSKRHVITLPHDLPRRKVNVIEFAMGKAAKIGSDSRLLSVIFIHVGLEPLE